MSVERIATRYSKSLVDLAVEQNKLEDVNSDMQYIKAVCKNADFTSVIKSPIIQPSKKAGVFKALFGSKVGDLTNKFLNTVLDKGRENYLPEMVTEFDLQYKKLKHISSVTLTTAEPLSRAAVDSILNKIKTSSTVDDNIELEVKVDPSLIGGFILRYDDKLYDTSVRHKLEQIKKEFNKNEYVKNL